MRILSLSTSVALLGLNVAMARANDCQSLQLSDGAAFTALSTLCNVGYPGGYGARQVESMAPQVPLNLGGTPAASVKSYDSQPVDTGYYDLVGNRYDNQGNLIAAAAPIPSKSTNTASPAPTPPPEGYHYETFALKPNSLGLKEGVRLVPDADNFGPQSTPTKETAQKPKDGLDGQPMPAQSTFADQPKPNLTSGNTAKPSEKNPIQQATPGNVPQTPAPDQKPLLTGDAKTSTPKDSTKIATQVTQTSPLAPNGYHYETFPLSPNSVPGFKGKEGVRLVPNADNFGPLPNATSINATVDKLNPGLNGLPMRAPSTFPDPQPQNSAASTPTLSPENNHNPVYAPGFSARDLLGRAMGDLPINGKDKIPYYDLANNVFDMKPVNGVKPTRWQDLDFAKNMPADLRKYFEDSGFRAGVYNINGKHILAFAGSEPLTHVSNLSQIAKDWWETDIKRDLGFNSKVGGALWNLALGTNKNWKDYQSDQTAIAQYVAAKLQKEYKDLQVTGQSLGGKNAAYTGALLKIPAVTFNATAVHFASGQAPRDPSYVLNFVIDQNIAKRTGSTIGNTITFDAGLTNTPAKYIPSKYISSNSSAELVKEGLLHQLVRFQEVYDNLKSNPKAGFSSLKVDANGYAEFTVGKQATLARPEGVVGSPLANATSATPGSTGSDPQQRPSVSTDRKSAETEKPAPAGKSASTDKSQPAGKSQRADKSQPVSKSPLTDKSEPTGKPQPTATYVHPTVTGFNQPRVIQAAFRQPGGISLTKAAAERMALNIDIDAITYRDGKIIIAGPQNAANKIDAALFLTAMRLACTPGDPFFSLDPVDGRAWQEQSRAAMDAAWKQAESSIKARLRSPFDVQTFSVQRDFAAIWAKIGSQYPELRAELVFRPEWLRETRFGEVLYKADVLLKELTVGIPVVTPGGPARMADIPGYIAPYKRGAARGLLVSKQTERQGWQGHRLWFDLMSQAGPDGPPAYEDPDANIDRNSNRALYATLKQRGLVDPPRPQPLQESTLYVENGIADISGVFPKMFILRHDAVTGRDIPGASPDLDLLSADVNKRTALYASAYQELRDLTGIFRAYIASTKIVKEEPDVCVKMPGELTGGEKVASALPEFHPSELFITAAYAQDSSAYRYSTSSSVSGGISLRGKQYYQQAVVEKETPLIAEIKRDLSAGVPLPEFKSASGRQYLAFDTRDPPRKIPIAAQ
jgi:hypothetical protein